MAIVKVKGLNKEYKMGRNNQVVALAGVDIEVKQGEFLAVMGPSGSGKSTLLNMIGTLDRPTKGSVFIGDIDVAKARQSKLPNLRNKKIGFIFQQYNLIPTLTAIENVMLPLKYSSIRKSEARKMAKESLEIVGLADRLKHKPAELSGGQQQRVAIARALVTKPDIILADEPTGELDTHTGKEIIQLMLDLNKKNKQTFIVITHNPEISQVCDRTIFIRDGKVSDN